MKNLFLKNSSNALSKIKQNRQVISIAIVGILLALGVGIWEYQIAHRPITALSRSKYDEMEYQETVIAKNQKGESFDVTLPIPGQIFTKEETKIMFTSIKEQLATEILGDNQSFSQIQQDMVLPTQLPQWPATIEWSSSNPTILDWAGKIGEKVSEHGETVQITAEIVYLDEVEEASWEVKVFPPILADREASKRRLIEAATAANPDQSTPVYQLPSEVDGEKISWFPFTESKSKVIVIMTLVLVSVMLIGGKQEEFKQQQMRKAQMQIDYPEILSKLILLMNAGMSMRMAFSKVALDYKKQKVISKQKNYCRHAYEEFWITYQEMEHGVFEVEAYERLGTRCGLAMYKVFAVLLIQNLKRGNQKLLEAMEREMANAFEERKRRAKILGEQAGTKLLLPMMVMLIIVFILLLVPAFLSF